MSTEQFSLKGRTALVTGSSTGLGKRMAMALGQAGAKVALNYSNNEERAAKAFAEFEATGAEGAMIRANVTDEADGFTIRSSFTGDSSSAGGDYGVQQGLHHAVQQGRGGSWG